jgi:hypothetical protein
MMTAAGRPRPRPGLPGVTGGYETDVRAPAHVYRRRRLVAGGAVLAVVAAGVLLAGTGGERPAERTGEPTPEPAAAGAELPRGGRSVLPEHRVVAFYGAPQSRELGALGIGTPAGAARRLAQQAAPYDRRRRPVLPALELITVIAAAHPGEDGMYRTRQEGRVIRRYLRAARRARALLLLDIQPGRSDFFTETIRLEKWLKEPDVGLALDPEWRMAPGEIPGQVIGSVGPREVNATSAWLDQLVERHRLPEKLFVVHQFTDDMVDEAKLKPRANLAMVLNADGFGDRPNKRVKYRRFTRQAPRFHPGFKLFYREDVDLMRPATVMALRPRPDFIVYE